MRKNLPTVSAAFVVASCLTVLNNQSAQAGGISLYEIATPDTGLASAGYAARADDASTLFKNPAGMSRLDGAQFQGGLQALYGSISFSPDANTSPRLGTDNGGNSVGWLPGGSLFVTVPVAERWQVGLGALSYFGLAADYGDNWVGRYYVQKSTLLGMSLMPSVSFKATEWLAIGAGLNAMYGYFDAEIAVNRLLQPDGKMSLKDSAWGFGANVGVLVKAGEQTRIGVTYLSPVGLDFADTPEFNEPNLAVPRKLDLGVTVPQSVMLSVYQGLNDKWAVMADFGWQDWSQFGYVQVGVQDGRATTLDLQYQDTWHGALGLQFRASEKWVISAGAAFDSSAVDSEHRTVTLPMGQTWRFGLGAQYQLSRSVNIGLGETFMWAGNMAVDQGSNLGLRGRVSGSFNDAWFSVTSLDLTWKF